MPLHENIRRLRLSCHPLARHNIILLILDLHALNSYKSSYTSAHISIACAAQNYNIVKAQCDLVSCLTRKLTRKWWRSVLPLRTLSSFSWQKGILRPFPLLDATCTLLLALIYSYLKTCKLADTLSKDVCLDRFGMTGWLCWSCASMPHLSMSLRSTSLRV